MTNTDDTALASTLDQLASEVENVAGDQHPLFHACILLSHAIADNCDCREVAGIWAAFLATPDARAPEGVAVSIWVRALRMVAGCIVWYILPGVSWAFPDEDQYENIARGT
jgi:hypothetical protein